MGKTKQSWFFLICAILLLGLTQLPFFYAFAFGSENHVFSGFLINPLDGNSYLAKMYQGYRGDWTFTLPYTAQAGKGSFLFIFYILLGHIARILNIPLIIFFHLARGFSSLVLVYTISELIKVLFDDVLIYRLAMIFACFGSGMGWLMMPSGKVTSDFWVAEAYPFLSSFVNPHFCLGIALMIWLIKFLIENQPPAKFSMYMYIAAASVILALLVPFALMIVLVISICSLFERLLILLKEKQSVFNITSDGKFRIFISILSGGLPVGVYQLYITNANVLLKGWQAQNVTPSPPIWDLIISFCPLIIFAIAGAYIAVRKKKTQWYPVVLWLVITMIFVYTPWSLQRRFLFGFYIPIVLLAMLILQFLKTQGSLKKFWIVILLSALFISSLTTNFVLEMTAFYGIKTNDPMLLLTRSESQALNWINTNTPPDSLVLASPQIGLFIPAQTGRRVIYGHPYETVDAAEKELQVTWFFSKFGLNSSQLQLKYFLSSNEVDYIFWGEKERSLSKIQIDPFEINWVEPVFKDNEVTIFQVIQ